MFVATKTDAFSETSDISVVLKLTKLDILNVTAGKFETKI